tara:strand:- start:85 stop:1068 length:984 start_codon:yes stop_codon:yes gene_type:complete
MAKTTFLNLVNGQLRYINQSELSTVSGATGHGALVKDKINEAVNTVYSSTNWYSLFKERKFQTSKNVQISVLDYTQTGGTITFTRNGVATVITEGSNWSNATSNDVSATALATGIVTAFGSTVVETEVSNEVVTVRNKAENDVGFTVIATSSSATYTVSLVNNDLYNIDSQFGRSIVLIDENNGKVMIEASPMSLSLNDPDDSESGNPTHFAAFGSHFRLYPIPSSTLTMVDRFYKIPANLTDDSDTIDLPLECEPLIIKLVQSELSFYLNSSIKGSSLRGHYNQMLEQAIEMNEYVLSKQNAIGGRRGAASLPMIPAQFPSGYPRG